MAVTINWSTKVINIPQSYLSSLGNNVFQLDVNDLRLSLKDIEDSEAGMNFPDTHRHNTEVVLGGVTLTRVVEIINGYTITFEDGQYAVNLVGANNNIPDVSNVNQVSIRLNNSAGLVSSGSGVTLQDKNDIANMVQDIINNTNFSVTAQDKTDIADLVQTIVETTDVTLVSDEKTEIIDGVKAALDPDLLKLMGLMHQNFRFTNQQYNADGNLISADVYLYGNSSNCQNNIDHIAQYTIVSTYDSNKKLNSYKMFEN